MSQRQICLHQFFYHQQVFFKFDIEIILILNQKLIFFSFKVKLWNCITTNWMLKQNQNCFWIWMGKPCSVLRSKLIFDFKQFWCYNKNELPELPSNFDFASKLLFHFLCWLKRNWEYTIPRDGSEPCQFKAKKEEPKGLLWVLLD
jgi:hypothetical protein